MRVTNPVFDVRARFERLCGRGLPCPGSVCHYIPQYRQLSLGADRWGANSAQRHPARPRLSNVIQSIQTSGNSARIEIWGRLYSDQGRLYSQDLAQRGKQWNNLSISTTEFDFDMRPKLPFRLLAPLVGLTASAFGQIDGAKFASDLHARFGSPMARETFRIDNRWEPGVEMVVDYSANGHVCHIQLPPYGSGKAGATPADELISDLIPFASRGKEKGRGIIRLGSLSISLVEYENLLVSEVWIGGARTRIEISLKNNECRKQPVP